MRFARLVVFFSVVVILSYIYMYITLHKNVPHETSRFTKDEETFGKLNGDEIQELYTKDYSISEIETRVQREREEIEQLFGLARRRLSDVILAGIFKSGTGTMSIWLSSHPQIVQVKHIVGYYETRYNYADHLASIPDIPNDKIMYERCTECFTSPNAVERVLAAYPQRNVKFLIMIRDPIVRLISEYIQRIVQKDEDKTFEEEIFTSNGEVHADISHKYVHRSIYVIHLAKWLMLFPRRNIHLVDAESFTQTPWIELEKIERFLQIDHFFSEDRFPPNPDKPNFRCFIDNFESEAHCMGYQKGRSHPNITEESIQKLRKYFKPYNEQFFTLAGQRFSWSVNYD
ncbi:unnamed protein product [Owenia fusiformis]|uniref:Uncharacterized protein n=1 Tax=Owenia fusiformis TaxID=6347 RepID=A0A8J1U5E9_OWEFU|nr:unnamed protein product [Owenia fusiformis]